jgi:hypothetical protein
VHAANIKVLAGQANFLVGTNQLCLLEFSHIKKYLESCFRFSPDLFSLTESKRKLRLVFHLATFPVFSNLKSDIVSHLRFSPDFIFAIRI